MAREPLAYLIIITVDLYKSSSCLGEVDEEDGQHAVMIVRVRTAD